MLGANVFEKILSETQAETQAGFASLLAVGYSEAMESNQPQHVQPEEICWLLDVRRYGIEAANLLHSEDSQEEN